MKKLQQSASFGLLWKRRWKHKPMTGSFRRRALSFLLVFLLLLSACSSGRAPENQPVRHQAGFFDFFDTYIQMIIYTESKEEFDAHFDAARQAFAHYHKLFDIFQEYPEINNIATINRYAGVSPVSVDGAVIELLEISKQAYFDTDGAVNIALGSVLSLWRDYRRFGAEYPDEARLPEMNSLHQAAEFTDIHALVIDRQAQTAFLSETGMSLDVGATAKSFAAERVADLLRARGVEAAIINAGGDIVTIGYALTGGGQAWGIGVQHPDGNTLLDVVEIENQAVSTSGGYRRAYVVEDVLYHHIIDPETLMPARGFLSVTVVHSSAMVTEILSTALFILPFDIGYDLALQMDAAVIWMTSDGEINTNEAYRAISLNFR